MKKLTRNQKEFLLNYFFKNEEYAGWRNIAIKLIETGKCIVAGRKRIWFGGIGNFIKDEEYKDAIECSLYTFDLEKFLSSDWYEGIRKEYASMLFEEKNEADKKYQEISTLYSFEKIK